MKRKFTPVIVGLVLLAIGFASGFLVSYINSGYHYEVIDTKNYKSPMGSIQWSSVTESVGWSFLDPGTTILEIEGRTIYKAKRYFQENVPVAKNVSTSNDHITWDDGEYLFDLTLRRMNTDESEQPLSAP
jgi:hypothetical protein